MELPRITVVRCSAQIPHPLSVRQIAQFLHESMNPWHDSIDDTEHGVSDALSGHPAAGGFVVCATGKDRTLQGALVMLSTGMCGYIPEHLLLFLAVAPSCRRRGIASRLLETARGEVDGGIKLHVEPENPARILYEQAGFSAKYLDMRLPKGAT